MNKLLISLCFVALALTASAQWAPQGSMWAQEQRQPQQMSSQMWTQPAIATNASQIAVQGQSWLVVAPEIVGMTVGFWNWNSSAIDALNTNTMIVNQTVSALMSKGISAENITTSFFTIEPYYGQQNMSGMMGQQMGYAVWNELSVVTMMLSEADELIAAIAMVPGASIQKVTWDVTDATRMMIRSQLQSQALADAKMQAQDAVMSVGNSLGAIASVNLVQPVNVEPKWVPSSVRTAMSTLMRPNMTMNMNNMTMDNETMMMNNDTMMMNNDTMMMNNMTTMEDGEMMMMNNMTTINVNVTINNATMDNMTMNDMNNMTMNDMNDMNDMTMNNMNMTNMNMNNMNMTMMPEMASPIFSGSLWYWASAQVVFDYINASA